MEIDKIINQLIFKLFESLLRMTNNIYGTNGEMWVLCYLVMYVRIDIYFKL